MAYDLLILSLGISGSIGALLCAYNISRSRVHYVGIVRRPPKREISDDDQVQDVQDALATIEFADVLRSVWGAKPRMLAIRGREIVLCKNCRLVQYRSSDERCRRCLKADLPPPESLYKKILEVVNEETQQSKLQESIVEHSKVLEFYDIVFNDLDKRIRRLEESSLRGWEEGGEEHPQSSLATKVVN